MSATTATRGTTATPIQAGHWPTIGGPISGAMRAPQHIDPNTGQPYTLNNWLTQEPEPQVTGSGIYMPQQYGTKGYGGKPQYKRPYKQIRQRLIYERGEYNSSGGVTGGGYWTPDGGGGQIKYGNNYVGTDVSDKGKRGSFGFGMGG